VAKVKTAYYCQNCGTQYPQWHGQCKNCGEWNTLVEEVIEKSASKNYSGEKKQHIINIIEVNAQEEPRIATPSDELNRVLGGGIVLGSVTLIGGEPGIGKSTLLLQLALKMRKRVLYVSGEESASQIKMRADRLTDLQNPNASFLQKLLWIKFCMKQKAAASVYDSGLYTDITFQPYRKLTGNSFSDSGMFLRNY
jgi:DNA repair protein RadA/Sms